MRVNLLPMLIDNKLFMRKNEQNLVWIDLEMTGLDTQKDTIIEIATIVTDSDLNILEEGPVMAIFTPDSVLNKMDLWCTTQHNSSGLISRVKNSSISLEDAELETLDFLQDLVPQGKSPMCGNSICQDRRFLARLMPKLESYFHYRNLDVSTLKELAQRWSPRVAEGLKKESKHLAIDDIRDSIEELKYYRKYFINNHINV